MPRRAFTLAFTLVELLVVIAIMVTLMSLIMAGVMLAKRSAMRAKTTAAISALASAIDQYRSLNNTYPELLKVDSTSTKDFGVSPLPGEVYAFYFSSAGTAKAVTAVQPLEWASINQALVYQLGSLISEQAPTGQVLDAWKTPLRYRPSKWYRYDSALIPRIDSENPPGADSYQMWSAGIDTKDDVANPGEGGDDIPPWAKQ